MLELESFENKRLQVDRFLDGWPWSDDHSDGAPSFGRIIGDRGISEIGSFVFSEDAPPSYTDLVRENASNYTNESSRRLLDRDFSQLNFPPDLDVVDVLRTLTIESGSIEDEKKAAIELLLLTKNTLEDRVKIARAGAIRPSISLISSSYPQLQEYGVKAILSCSLCDENKEEDAAYALIFVSQVEEYKRSIGRSGAIPLLVDLLETGSFRGKKDASTALYSLCSVKENRIRAVQAGIMEPLVELMVDCMSDMVDKSVSMVSVLVSSFPEAREVLVEEGGIPVLVEIVEIGSQRQKEIAVVILLQLCDDSVVYRTMMVREGAIPALVALSQSGTNGAKQKAKELIELIRRSRSSNRVANSNSSETPLLGSLLSIGSEFNLPKNDRPLMLELESFEKKRLHPFLDAWPWSDDHSNGAPSFGRIIVDRGISKIGSIIFSEDAPPSYTDLVRENESIYTYESSFRLLDRDFSQLNFSMHLDLVDVLRTLTIESGSIEDEKKAAMELLLLTKNTREDREKIARAGAIRPSISLISSSYPQLQGYGVNAILSCLLCDENKEEDAAYALIFVSRVEEYKTSIGRSGAIILLVDLLETGNFRGKKYALTALYSLCSVNENKIRAVDAGIMEPLVELMEDFESDMVYKSASMVSVLVSTFPEARKVLVAVRGIPVLLEIVEVGSQRQKEIAVVILLQLCVDCVMYRRIVFWDGGVPALVALSESGTNGAKQKAKELIELLPRPRSSNN